MNRLIKTLFFGLVSSAPIESVSSEKLHEAYEEFAALLCSTTFSEQEEFKARYNILSFTYTEISALQGSCHLSGTKKKHGYYIHLSCQSQIAA